MFDRRYIDIIVFNVLCFLLGACFMSTVGWKNKQESFFRYKYRLSACDTSVSGGVTSRDVIVGTSLFRAQTLFFLEADMITFRLVYDMKN